MSPIVEGIEPRCLARLLNLSDERVRQVLNETDEDNQFKVAPQFDIYIGARPIRLVALESALNHWFGKQRPLDPFQIQYLNQLRALTIVTAITYQVGSENPKESDKFVVNVLGSALFPARRTSGAE